MNKNELLYTTKFINPQIGNRPYSHSLDTSTYEPILTNQYTKHALLDEDDVDDILEEIANSRTNSTIGGQTKSVDSNIELTYPISGDNEIMKHKNINSSTNDSTFLHKNANQKSEQSKTQKTIERLTRINIDSTYRNINPINKFSSNILVLGTNPLSLTKDSNILSVYHPDHGLSEEDKITLQNVVSNYVQLRNPIVMTANSPYVKILHPNHGFDIDYNKYNDIEIEISGVVGNTNNDSYINNIPVNIINKKHIVYLQANEYDNIDSNYYYILLELTPNQDYQSTSNIVTVKYMNLCGIPLYYLNAGYPLGITQYIGYHTIYDITDTDNYTIELKTKAVKTITSAGGRNVTVRKIEESLQGHPSPNDYEIELGQTFYNVKGLKLLSTEIPNTERLIKNAPTNKKNNTLYWQNLEDGDTIYSIDITPGNYTPSSLATEIQTKIEETERSNIDIDNATNDDTNKYITYNDLHKATITIDSDTDITTFKMYKEVIIEECLELQQKGTDDHFDTIKINHKNHYLEVGDLIIISNAIMTDGIPESILNQEHTITEVIDENNYIIQLPMYNLNDDTEQTLGGKLVTILSPLKFRMLFNYTDTPGLVLGFRNPGIETSITPFNSTISNTTEYEIDYLQDSTGTTTVSVTNNILNFCGENYILLTCPYIKSSLNTGTVSNIFAKILLTGSPGNIIFNSYIILEDEFSEIVPTLSSLRFSFYSPDGILFDFNNLNHSMTIEVIEIINKPEKTRINTRIGSK